MTDRLTQLQVCLDQLVAQFNATINYVNTNSSAALLDADESSYFNLAASAPLPGAPAATAAGGSQPGGAQDPPSAPSAALNSSVPPGGADSEAPPSNKQSPGGAAAVASASDAKLEAEQNFNNTINELSTDIILKSRQLSMLIDSLPGIGVSPTNQLQLIEELARELETVETERIRKIEEKDKLLTWCESLIMDVADGISKTRY